MVVKILSKNIDKKIKVNKKILIKNKGNIVEQIIKK